MADMYRDVAASKTTAVPKDIDVPLTVPTMAVP